MANLKEVVDLAVSKGLTSDSRILNVTHWDMDGYVSTVNIHNFLNTPKTHLSYFSTSYDNIDMQIKGMIDEPNNNSYNDVDFVLITDVSVSMDIARLFQDVKQPVYLILDHHESAYPINRFANCHVDDTSTKCGAEVTLHFLKEVAKINRDRGALHRLKNLLSLNKIATNYDLWFWPKQEGTYYVDGIIQTSIPDQMNRYFFALPWKGKAKFIERWKDGWGDGFTDEENAKLLANMKDAIEHINNTEVHELTPNIGFAISSLHFNDVAAHIRDKYQIAVLYNLKQKKISVRVKDDLDLNLAPILEDVGKKFKCRSGGHSKAGGINNFVDLDAMLEYLIEKLENGLDALKQPKKELVEA